MAHDLLPAEMLAHIAAFLAPEDCLTMRMVCRAWNERLPLAECFRHATRRERVEFVFSQPSHLGAGIIARRINLDHMDVQETWKLWCKRLLRGDREMRGLDGVWGVNELLHFTLWVMSCIDLSKMRMKYKQFMVDYLFVDWDEGHGHFCMCFIDVAYMLGVPLGEYEAEQAVEACLAHPERHAERITMLKSMGHWNPVY